MTHYRRRRKPVKLRRVGNAEIEERSATILSGRRVKRLKTTLAALRESQRGDPFMVYANLVAQVKQRKAAIILNTKFDSQP